MVSYKNVESKSLFPPLSTIYNQDNLSLLESIRNDLDLKINIQKLIDSNLIKNEQCVEIFYDKVSQYQFLKDIDESLVFHSVVYDSLSNIFFEDNKSYVVRPSFSEKSKGSAIIFGGHNRIDQYQVPFYLATSDRYIVHEYLKGNPIFINGVFKNNKLYLTDVWECTTREMEYKDVQVAVINSNNCVDQLTKNKLECICQEMGLINSPIHFEVIFTENEVKIVKFSPRLSTYPLPELCCLNGNDSQLDGWKKINTNFPVWNKNSTYVADFSFIFWKSGVLRNINIIEQIKKLKSYASIQHLAEIGLTVNQTQDGDNYACTVFLQNGDLSQIQSDLDYLYELDTPLAFYVE